MTYEQLAIFLQAAQQHCPRRDSVLFLTLADTGMRPGEALALQWPDVDTSGRTINVERAVSGGLITSTKTGESRAVDVSTRLAEALASWQASIEADALVRGKTPSDYVFPSELGSPSTPTRLVRDFQALLRRAGARDRIRTRVCSPPRALVSMSGGSAALSQLADLRD